MEYINGCGVPKDDKCCCRDRHYFRHCPVLLECGMPILQECCDEPIKQENA